MKQSAIEHDELHPKPRIGGLRRFASWLVLILLSTIIGGYWYITDSERLKQFATVALEQKYHGRVEIGRASLSIFEGLRLEDVRVYVDKANAADSCIFMAKVLRVTVSLQTLRTARLETSQITAIEPRVRLVENVDNAEKRWNYERIERRKPDRPSEPGGSSSPLTLPQLLLCAGTVEYGRISRGKFEVVGTVSIDGQLLPLTGGGNRYALDLDSRLPGRVDGPRLRGTLDMDRLAIKATLDNVRFSQDVAAVLPSQVQAWWCKHQLAGNMSISEIQYVSGQAGQPDDFRVVVETEGVGLTIWPDEMMDEEELAIQKSWRPGIRTDIPVVLPMIFTPDALSWTMSPRPVRLTDVSGRFTFTPSGISISTVRAVFEQNRIFATGEIGGYSDRAPFKFKVFVPRLQIPHLPSYIWSMPGDVRKIWSDFRPAGVGRIVVDVSRSMDAPSRRVAPYRSRSVGGIKLEATLDVIDGAFTFHELPYPLRHVRGQLWFGKDKITGLDRIEFRDFICMGAAGTENENTVMHMNGWVSPVTRNVGMGLVFTSEECALDPLLRGALPHEVREIIDKFDIRKNDVVVTPAYARGPFEARVTRTAGPGNRVNVDVDLDIRKGTGAFESFAYPMRSLTGQVKIRPNAVFLEKVTEHKPDGGFLRVDGTVTWGSNQPVEPNLTIRGMNVPIDEDLLGAMPAEQRQWMRKTGLGGRLNMKNGRIMLVAAEGDWQIDAAEPGRMGAPTEVGFDLDFHLVNGSMSFAGQKDVITGMTADARLTDKRLTLEQADGQLGGADVSGRGTFWWPNGKPKASLFVFGTALRADEKLLGLLPAAVRGSAEDLRASGTLDMQFQYGGGVDENDTASYKVTLTPRELAIRPKVFDWEFRDLRGKVVVTPEGVAINELRARHGETMLKIDGGSKNGKWTLSASGEGVVVDDEFASRCPDALKDFLKAIALKSSATVNLPKVTYTPAAGSAPSVLEIEGTIGVADASMDVGIPITKFNGSVELKASIVGDELRTLTGSLTGQSAVVADRQATGIRCSIRKLPEQPTYRFEDLGWKMAGGNAGGVVKVVFPKNRPVEYEVQLAVNDADVRELTADKEEKLRGRLRASLNLSGKASDPSTRLGRGFIDVEGEDLLELPAMTGLLQITNLALPIKSPFNTASARYAVVGERVVFEQIELRAPDMLMRGSGQLDYAKKTMSMRLETSNPNWIKLVGVDPLIQFFKNEFVTIEVHGSIKEPQVNAKSMINASTTIDRVFKAPPPRSVKNPDQPPKK